MAAGSTANGLTSVPSGFGRPVGPGGGTSYPSWIPSGNAGSGSRAADRQLCYIVDAEGGRLYYFSVNLCVVFRLTVWLYAHYDPIQADSLQ